MFPDTIQRLSSQRATCKQWSTALAVVILLVGALGQIDGEKLLWAAAPILLLGLAEAGYAAQERRVAEHLKGKKATDPMSPLQHEPAGASIGRIAVAVTSVSIWPFYAAMGAIVAVGGGTLHKHEGEHETTTPVSMASHAVVQAKASAGGCGSGGCGSGGAGCGSGGCGASAGKACGCSSGGSKAAAPKPVLAQQPIPQNGSGQRPLTTAAPGSYAGRVMPARPPMYPQQGGGPARVQPVQPIQPGNMPPRPSVVPVVAPAAPIAPGAPAAPRPPSPVESAPPAGAATIPVTAAPPIESAIPVPVAPVPAAAIPTPAAVTPASPPPIPSAAAPTPIAPAPPAAVPAPAPQAPVPVTTSQAPGKPTIGVPAPPASAPAP